MKVFKKEGERGRRHVRWSKEGGKVCGRDGVEEGREGWAVFQCEGRRKLGVGGRGRVFR